MGRIKGDYGMREIEWRGTFDVSGYGIWGRKLVDVLVSSKRYKVKVISARARLEKHDPFFKNQDFRFKNAIRVENLIPTFPPGGKRTGFCTCTEMRKPPEDQSLYLEKSKFVIALSEFSTNAYKEILTKPEKVHKINFPMFRGEFNPMGSRIDFTNLKQYKFKFLTVGQIDVRKNIDTLIKAFKEEFGDNRNVCLILKIYSPNYCVPMWIKEHNPSPNIFWLEQRVNDMANLYRSCNAYITTDLGEAWSGPTQEAMLSGIPAIAPRHSGHLDYMTDKNSYLIDVGEWDRIGHRTDNYYERLLPAYGEVKYPNFVDIKAKMRQVYEEFRGFSREDVLNHPKVKEGFKTQDLVDRPVILKQLDDCFDWVEENVR